ncbi:MAG: four-carbon acid sugar kinase family protein [Pseudomonadota bacterium]|nr:four-carbon acid sugar kinase family protein [Pseudomonadota bacterium]
MGGRHAGTKPRGLRGHPPCAGAGHPAFPAGGFRLNTPPVRRLLSWYGDDLTGSTDAMEALTLAGLSSVLFLDPATPAQLRRFAHCQAIGLAGTSRSQTPEWMDAHLPDAFAWLRGLGADVCHYKVCSTFDSSPAIGSIGRALEIGQRSFGQMRIPIIVGVPQLRRYTFFGHLHAGFRDEVHRIDRHPVMACHPVTPMAESDLRRHLARQTRMPVDLLDWQHLSGLDAAGFQALPTGADGEARGLLIDVIDQATQSAAGRAVWWLSQERGSPLVIGSSGVEYGLVPVWRQAGLLAPAAAAPPVGAVERIAVVSGSCSATTARQIRWAGEHGYALVPIDARSLASATDAAGEEDRVYREALQALNTGNSVIAYSALGPDHLAPIGAPTGPDSGPHVLGSRIGRLLRRLVAAAGLRRVVIAGGDTSSHALRELDVTALTVALPLPQSPGSPLCRAHSASPVTDGLEVALKGGQIGADDYFERIRLGSASH